MDQLFWGPKIVREKFAIVEKPFGEIDRFPCEAIEKIETWEISSYFLFPQSINFQGFLIRTQK